MWGKHGQGTVQSSEAERSAQSEASLKEHDNRNNNSPQGERERNRDHAHHADASSGTDRKLLYNYRECRDSIEDVKQFLQDTEIPQVTQHKNEKLDQPITPEEVKSFLFSLSDNKAPGTSGLTPAYYKAVWSYTGNLITEAIAECLQHRKIPECQRKGAIVLIPKSGKDQRYMPILQ